MDFRCPLCGEIIPRELLAITAHGQEHILDEIKKKHPKWVEKDGLCKKCYDYYKNQIHPGG